MDPPPIPLIKIRTDKKSEKYYLKIKLRRNPTPETSYMYEFKMALFDNADLEEFLLFQWNCQFTIKASGIITSGEKSSFYILCYVENI